MGGSSGLKRSSDGGGGAGGGKKAKFEIAYNFCPSRVCTATTDKSKFRCRTCDTPLMRSKCGNCRTGIDPETPMTRKCIYYGELFLNCGILHDSMIVEEKRLAEKKKILAGRVDNMTITS